MMPFYGRVDHFRQAVESVLAQDDADWRLVVIDDAYPDLSATEWLVSLGDSRIVSLRNATNVGINANFQRSIDLAQSEWMTIMGCDDVLLPGYVSHIKSLIEANPRATIVHPGVRIIDDEGAITRTVVDISKSIYAPRASTTVELSGEKLAISVTRGNWMYFPSVAWHRAAISSVGFRTGLTIVQDLALVLDLCFSGARLVVDNNVVFEYRRHSASVSSRRAVEGSRFIEEQLFFRSIAEQFDDRGWHRAARAARLHISSRLNALTRLPGAISARSARSVGILVRHAAGIAARR